MIEVREEDITELWDEAWPLLQEHWREIAHYQDIPLDPDRDAYAALERADLTRCYTAREDGKLIGYVVFFVRPNLHYRTSRQALQDVLFLLPEYRRGRAGLTLIKVAETRLRAEGVQVVYHHAKCSNQVGRLLEHIGYELVDGVYGKRLD
jgi:GNAT superfamily N-acetyltransferase